MERNDKKMDMSQFKRLYIIHATLLANMGSRVTARELMDVINGFLGQDITERTLRNDIKILRGEDYANAPIHKSYYQYNEPFTFWEVLNLPPYYLILEAVGILRAIEKEKFANDNSIKKTLNDLILKLKEAANEIKTIHFEENTHYVGRKHIEALQKYIVKQYVIKFKYQRFNKSKETIVLHPYLLKEYNDRWYLYGLDANDRKVKQFGLERIVELSNNKYFEITKAKFIEKEDFVPDTYFNEMVGITKSPGDKVQRVVVRVHGDSIEYVRTKPIHHSQRSLKGKKDEIPYQDFEYKIIVNYEFKSKILALGSNAEIREPKGLREEFINEIAKLKALYE